MTLVIMAAGMGSRFGGLKQIEPVGPSSEFIIDYSIYDAILSGFKEVVFIIKEENYDIFRSTIGKRIEDKIKVTYVFQNIKDTPVEIKGERIKPWGTGQAILATKDVIKDNFMVINADDFYGRDAYTKLSEFLKNNTNSNEFAMAGYQIKNTLGDHGSVKRGICESEKEYLTKLVESVVERQEKNIIATPLDGSGAFKIEESALVSMNAFAFTKDIFPYLEKEWLNFFQNIKDIEKDEFLLPMILEKMIRENKCQVKVLKTDATWYGITYKEDKPKVMKAIQNLVDNKEYPSNLWNE